MTEKMNLSAEYVSPIRRATAEFNVARWLRGEGPQRDRPSLQDLHIAGYSVVKTEDLHAGSQEPDRG